MNSELFEKHLLLVLKANETTNITRIKSFEEGKLLHIEDSLSCLEDINAAPEGALVDLGTGAGFPGIPLAIETKRNTLLVDSVRKKTDILNNILPQLGIDNYVSTYHGRIEDLAKEKSGCFAVATARALSSLSSLLELASPLLMINGILICYKSHVDQEELEHTNKIKNILGMRLVSNREFYLSDNQTFRTILTFEKFRQPSVKLPRQSGKAQKSPL